MIGEWSQHHQRVSSNVRSGRFFRDQHGRTWHAEVEKSTNHACGPYRLHQPRHAPLPDAEAWIRIVKNDDGEYRDHDIFVDYDSWLAQCIWAWRILKAVIAKKKMDMPHLSESEIAMREGNPILHPRVLQEAKDGNGYLLGLRPFDPSIELDGQLKRYVDPEDVTDDYSWISDEFAPKKKPAPSFEDPAEPEDERPEMIRALKAQGKSWAEIATTMELHPNTCMKLAKQVPEAA